MAVGRPIDKATIDGQTANWVIQLNTIFANIARATAVLDGISDNTFTVTGIPKSQSDPTLVQYSAGDLTATRNTYRDLNKLGLVYQGLYYVAAGATQNTGVPTANDGTHWGYPFNLAGSQIAGLGF